jgi:hypothetical protein
MSLNATARVRYRYLAILHGLMYVIVLTMYVSNFASCMYYPRQMFRIMRNGVAVMC